MAPEVRRTLALNLFFKTISQLKSAVDGIDEQFDIAVVTESSEIDDLSRSRSLRVIRSSYGMSLSQYLNSGGVWAEKNNYTSICIIPADLADPRVSDLKKLLSYPIKHKQMVICPAKDLGTNALFVSPPTALMFSFGRRSFLRHLKEAEMVGLEPIILPLDSIKKDVDTSDDLDELLSKFPKLVHRGANSD